ncbi:MAG: branched-chain amino acid ABC transporter substrate-binding protein [Betaproteobacteria bacterium]|jgi:branched-chain amino acid transport system substrate-binding protein|nr:MULTISPECIES: branched-chain amino acid ABC transporter substrate-binding protein [Thiomonas]MDE2129020.1 branched-chain amino acid ABC transporter substrate-binding protein [Betaproteobacteria bacterium]OZB45377.1 MAG: branched chain amino acid ABC transporter substrate-binding protein [Thiomonas sp. 15-66-11]OZB63642.1 MAG: branched chain amino acid ABC transporter substrate-binding protein [Thiomonas sp. 13-66-29]SBP88367.1 putative ABC-type branched-chain amino acid transport systems, pe
MKLKYALLGLSLAIGTAYAADDVTVVIGSAAPMSGPQAAFGQDNTNGVRMAINDLNKQNIMIGGKKVIWKIDAQDDQADPKQATSVAQKFVDEKVNGVVGHLNSGCTFPASRIYNNAGIPNITPSSTDPKIAEQGFKTFFRIIANDNALGAGLANYAKKELKAKTVAVIDDRTAYGQGVADVFAATAKKDGLKVLDREYTNDKATDFSAILTKIKSTNPDVIFYGGMYTQAGPLARQLKQLGIKATLMGGDGICAPDLAKLGGDAVNGTVCAEGGSPLSQMPGGEAWKKRYDAEFGAKAFQIYSPYSYDATMVLAKAMEKAKSTDPKKYLSYIQNIDYNGVTKNKIHFMANGNLADPSITISKFEGGEKKVVAVEQVK